MVRRSSTPSAGIRSYNLFGESAELPDVLHVETIAARSSLHAWELSAHRHGRLHQLLFVRSGGGTAWLSDTTVALGAAHLVNVPAGEVHAFRFRPGTRGWVVMLADGLIEGLLSRCGDERRVLGNACVVPAGPAIDSLMRQLQHEFDARAAARALVLRGLAATLLGQVARAIDAAQPVPARGPDHVLLRRFEALLETHFTEHWPVAAYARALAVTPTHLSRITRAATGLATSRLIDERLVREARRHLAYTQAPIKAVADTLGFGDPAYFTRVFRRAAGLAPREYRERFAPRA
jgi:AraC family transcriptional activator of pobA